MGYSFKWFRNIERVTFRIVAGWCYQQPACFFLNEFLKSSLIRD